MYVQPNFEETRVEALHDLMRRYPLATLVAVIDGEIVANHIPCLLVSSAGDHGMLHGHLPKANPIWEHFRGQTKAVAIFQGPQSYVTPSWYPSKQDHGKVVPTWNYAVVHAHGQPYAIDNADWLMEHLNSLTDEHESNLRNPWSVSDAPEEFTERMLSGLVGFEMSVTRLVGKWKLSQNRSKADRLGVAAGLRSRGDSASLSMESLIVGNSNDRSDDNR